MKLFLRMTAFGFFLNAAAAAERKHVRGLEPTDTTRTRMTKKKGALKGGGGSSYKKPKKDGKERESFCDRPSPFSVATPNDSWPPTHTYNPQVWYLSLEDTYKLWEMDYFDYVIDVRGIEDVEKHGILLPGWESEHIPGTYPINIDCLTSDCDTLALPFFMSSGACLDAKILVHCWKGVTANNAAKVLIELGFTNLYSMGPEGAAGFLNWKDMGYPIVYDDIYVEEYHIPECAAKCA